MAATSAQPKPGKVIRVSSPLYDILDEKKPEAVSWDAFLRKTFGIHPRKKRGIRAREFWLLPSSGRIYETAAEARGEAVMQAAALGRREAEAPLRLREVL